MKRWVISRLDLEGRNRRLRLSLRQPVVEHLTSGAVACQNNPTKRAVAVRYTIVYMINTCACSSFNSLNSPLFILDHSELCHFTSSYVVVGRPALHNHSLPPQSKPPDPRSHSPPPAATDRQTDNVIPLYSMVGDTCNLTNFGGQLQPLMAFPNHTLNCFSLCWVIVLLLLYNAIEPE
jgi:hypothetical protein